MSFIIVLSGSGRRQKRRGSSRDHCCARCCGRGLAILVPRKQFRGEATLLVVNAGGWFKSDLTANYCGCLAPSLAPFTAPFVVFSVLSTAFSVPRLVAW